MILDFPSAAEAGESHSTLPECGWSRSAAILFSSVLLKPPSWAVIAGRRPAFNLLFRQREELHFTQMLFCVTFLTSGFSTFLPGCDFHSQTHQGGRCCGDDGCPQVQRHRTEPWPQHTQAAIVLLQDTLRLYFSVGDLSGFSSPGRPPTQQIYEAPSCWNVDETLQLCDKDKKYICGTVAECQCESEGSNDTVAAACFQVTRWHIRP